MRVLFGISICVAMAWFVFPNVGRADATDFDEIVKFVASDGGATDEFGTSISVSGDFAFVGAPGDDDGANQAGAVYVYRIDASGWVEEQKLLANDPSGGARFGSSVFVDGDVAVIGAPGAQSFRGAAYAFRYDGSEWVEEQKLVASTTVGIARYGTSVFASGDVVLIGAPGDIEEGTESGAAHVFRYDSSTWVEEQKLLASDALLRDEFGSSVSVSGDVALVGAVGEGNDSGAAYVYRFDGSTWSEEQRLRASDRAQFDNFGHAAVVSGDVALITAVGDDSERGSAYFFRFDGGTWIENQKLTASDRAAFDRFGESISISDDLAVIGARDDDNGDMSGSVYVYRFDGSTWAEDQKRTASDGEESDFFGRSVGISGGVMLVGAPGDDDNGDAVGAGYVFYAAKCFAGAVNAGIGSTTDVLFVNGSAGGVERQVELTEGDLVTVTVVKPVGGGNGKFVLHADQGAPTLFTRSVLPLDVGTSCFTFLTSAGASPVIVTNNLGKANQLGESRFFETPADDPDRATTNLYFPDLPVGMTLTLQGLIVDPGAESSRGVSTTNAVIVSIVP